jgi:thiol-disulfide isomerase/thioredoxin
LEFAKLDGSRLSMAALLGKPLLLNFWATWCPPCVEELPLLSSFHEENAGKGWQVLGLAVDQADPVKRFLAKAPVAFPVALAGVSGIELGKSLGNLSGGLPFTVVFGSDGLVAHRKMGKVAPDDLRAWALLK